MSALSGRVSSVFGAAVPFLGSTGSTFCFSFADPDETKPANNVTKSVNTRHFAVRMSLLLTRAYPLTFASHSRNYGANAANVRPAVDASRGSYDNKSCQKTDCSRDLNCPRAKHRGIEA